MCVYPALETWMKVSLELEKSWSSKTSHSEQSQTCPGSQHSSRSERLLKCPGQPMETGRVQPRRAPGDSCFSSESVDSVATLFELLPASDADAIHIYSTLSRVFHRPSRRWASQVSRARTAIPSTPAVPISGIARVQQAFINTASQSITANLVSHHGTGLPASVCSRCCRAELQSCAGRSGDTRMRLHPYRRRPSSRRHVSLFSVGDEADKKESAAMATVAVRHSPRLSGI